MRNPQNKVPHAQDKKARREDYHFIRETIKKRPMDLKVMLTKAAAVAGAGVLFGVCAAAVILSTVPDFSARAGGEDTPKVDIPRDTPIVTREPQVQESKNTAVHSTEETAAAGPARSTVDSSLESYGKISEELQAVTQKPEKALVTVTGEKEKENVLDNSNIKTGQAYGVIFLDDGENLYILTEDTATREASSLTITFADGTAVQGFLQESDRRLGMAVVMVPTMGISQQTRDKLEVVSLGNSYSIQKSEPVIAIGSPAGYPDSVILGRVTSISGRICVSDGEYDLIITDIPGSEQGSGILLNLEGEVIGLLAQEYTAYENAAPLVKALAISQLKPIIEALANGTPVSYVGIYGKEIPENMKESWKLSGGVYVDMVEEESPAMKGGIQSGDIIIAVGGQLVDNPQDYFSIIQKYDQGQQIKFTLMRKKLDGHYEEIKLTVTAQKNS